MYQEFLSPNAMQRLLFWFGGYGKHFVGMPGGGFLQLVISQYQLPHRVETVPVLQEPAVLSIKPVLVSE